MAAQSIFNLAEPAPTKVISVVILHQNEIELKLYAIFIQQLILPAKGFLLNAVMTSLECLQNSVV